MIKKFKLYIMLVAVALSSVSCLDKMPEDGIPFDESLQTVSDINLAVKVSTTLSGANTSIRAT